MKNQCRGFLAIIMLCMSWMANGQMGKCRLGTSRVDIESENVMALLMNQGDYFWDPVASEPKFQWPKMSSPGKHLMFAAGHWFGGKNLANNALVVSAQTYRGPIRTFWPGPAGPTSPDSAECSFWDQHFEMDQLSLSMFQTLLNTSTLPLNPAAIPGKIRNWPGKGNPLLKAMAQAAGYPHISAFDQDLAPFVDVDGNGIYNPTLGDYPDMKGRLSMVWWVMNDVGNTKNFIDNSQISPPANLEFQILAYSYPVQNDQHYLANSIFLEQKIINRGSRTLDTCYTGFWMDQDIGNPNDDYVQSDVMRNLAICFNGDNLDEGATGYGVNPPAIAFKAVDGPSAYPADGIDNNRNGVIDEAGEKSLFSGFGYFQIGLEAQGLRVSDYYNFLSSKWKNGALVTYGGVGTNPVSSTSPPATFMYPGNSDPVGYGLGGTPQNPVALPAWSEITSGNAMGDRRALMSAGPFQLLPGASITYSVVNLIAFGGTNLENLAQLGLISDSLDQFAPVLLSVKDAAGEKETSLRIFPNPGSGRVMMECASPIKSLMVRDLQGRIVFESKAERSMVSTDLSGFPSGVYSVQVQTAKGVQVKKWVKM